MASILKIARTTPRVMIGLLLLSALLGIISSCSQLSPVSPESFQNSNEHTGVTPRLLPKDQLQILNINPHLASRSAAVNQAPVAQRFIEAREGGEVTIGTSEGSDVQLLIPRQALPASETIEMRWRHDPNRAATGYDFQFGPHGTVFQEPVTVVFSYRNADLTGIDEANLRVWYFNEETQLWELIGGEVDTRNKTVTVKLAHFSRYAISYS